LQWGLVDLSSGYILPNQWIRINDTSIVLVYDVRKPHALLGKAKGYLPVSVALNDTDASLRFRNLQPEAIEVGKKLVLCNIFFEVASSVLNPESEVEIDFIASWMKQNSGWSFEISGHTDNIGKELDNQLLSLKRAEIVKNTLIKRGVKAELLFNKGYGSKKPVASNSTQEGRAQNRRTELKVIGKQH
jgi:outer membrane protein OmpA-like peptidoglycan-associated protein